MCHKKVEKMMKIVKIGIFGKMIPHHLGNIPRPKTSNFDEKIAVFYIMVRSTLPYTCLWGGLRLVFGVPALLHDFDTLTLYF